MQKNKTIKNLINTKLIEKYLQDNNLSKTEFCKICEISKSTLSKIMKNENVRLIAIFKIARVLNVHLYQMFNNTHPQ